MDREINKVIVHCSATPKSMDIGVRQIKDWHVNENGWSDIGYHYVIRRGGLLEEGRPLERAGAHTKGHNKDSVGICMVGGTFTGPGVERRPEANFTFDQYRTLNDLLQRMYVTFKLTSSDVYGHHNFTDKKTCPNFDVQAFAQQGIIMEKLRGS